MKGGMLGFIEYLGIPISIGVFIVALFFILQIIGALIELKGYVAPGIMNVRKYFARKKREAEMIEKMAAFMTTYASTFDEIKGLKGVLREVNSHYCDDKIKERDEWINTVNRSFEEIYKQQEDLCKKLDSNNEATLSMLLDNKRSIIMNFASKVVDDSYAATREQFKKAFSTYTEYEQLITKYNKTNGEVDIAIRIITEAYETRLRDHTFIEDARGY